ncbi:hypothetical protein DRQ20_06885 [bacterium]|nr:MAG: hypothetical protein DRQ20_06885 [bacterium]
MKKFMSALFRIFLIILTPLAGLFAWAGIGITVQDIIEYSRKKPVIKSVNLPVSTNTGKKVTLSMKIRGSTDYIGVHVTWGDGTTSLWYFLPENESFSLSHSYTSPGKYRVKIHLLDTRGRENNFFKEIAVTP